MNLGTRETEIILIPRIARCLFYLWAGLIVLIPNVAAALDEGGAKMGLSYYSTKFNSIGQNASISEAYSNLEFFQRITNYGVLEGRIAYSYLQQPQGSSLFQQSSGWQQAYGRLTFRDFRWGRGVLGLSAGDQDLVLSNFPIAFTNFFYPTIYLRGFGGEWAQPKVQLKVLGGEVTTSRGLLGETFIGLGEGMYGFLLQTQPLDGLNLESDLFATNNEKDYNGFLITKHNVFYRLASQYRAWSQLVLAGEFLQSFSENRTSRQQQDIAYRVGSLWKGERLRLEANYRDMGPRFHLINPIYFPYQGVNGYQVAGDVTPWPFVSISGSYDSAKTNLFQEPGFSFSETSSRSAGLRIYRQPWPTLSLNYYDNNLSSRSDFPVLVRAQTQGLFAEMTKRFVWLEPYARYEYLDYRDLISASNSYVKTAPQIGLRGYHEKVIWYIQGENDKYTPPSQGQGFIGPYFKVGLSYTYSSNLFVSAELTYRTETGRFGGQGNINWRLPYNFQLQAFGYYEKGNAGPGSFLSNYLSTQISVRLTKTLSWGTKGGIAGLKPGQEMLGSGTIEGWVFNDANLSGNKDADEVGVEGIKVKLEDGSEVATDQRGYYKFSAVAAGKHVVTLDAKRIPAAYTFLGSETTGVEVRRRSDARVDFPFAKGASIKGRIVQDTTGSGKPAPDAKGVPDVLVLLEPGNLNTYADSDGYFAFEGVLPKAYELSLDRETLPERSEITSSRLPLQIDLKPGEQKKDLLILVQPLKRHIIYQ